jgi:hypothetical protein
LDDDIRLAAIAEVNWMAGGGDLCVAVADGASGETVRASLKNARDPTGTFAIAISRLKGVYPQSQCGRVARGTPLYVDLAPVEKMTSTARASVIVQLWRQNAVDEVRQLIFHQISRGWELERNVLFLQH